MRQPWLRSPRKSSGRPDPFHLFVIKPYFENNHGKIYQANFFEISKEFAVESVELIVTDPAYWTLDKHRSTGTTTRLGGNADPDKRSGWFDTIDESQLNILMRESFRILKNNHHAYLMCDGQTLRSVLYFSPMVGFSNFKPIVWDKINPGMGYHYRCRHEYFVMLDKGANRQLNSAAVEDVWQVPFIRDGYPTEKPLKLMEIPIMNSSDAGETVFDPFMGGAACWLPR